ARLPPAAAGGRRPQLLRPEGPGRDRGPVPGEPQAPGSCSYGQEAMIRRLVTWFLASFRLNNRAVCEASRGLGMVDYHDYPNSVVEHPGHFVTNTGRRCGKQFVI